MSPKSIVQSGTTLDLNAEFKRALELMENTNKNIFLTGKAGTGKSTLLGYFMEHTKKNVVVLAPTGVAALNVKGETIHSFFGFMPNITVEKSYKKGKKAHEQNNDLYASVQTIIIDEVSMVRADLMDCVDEFLRAARKNGGAFGGVQMIFIGDLYQLPPVVTRDEEAYFREMYESPWFFHANVFQDEHSPMQFIELEKIYRQKDDEFIELLNAIRTNTVTEKQMKKINARHINSEKEQAEKHADLIQLTSTNKLADEINERHLQKLKTKSHLFEADIKGNFEMKHCPTDPHLVLKTGAQVMFVYNDSAGQWVNGTLGYITRIDPDTGVTVKIHDGEEVFVMPNEWKLYKYEYDRGNGSLSQHPIGSFTQIPLKLAWAITIHKSQGKTFDRVHIDLGNGSFASGQTYVALSRCRTFEGITLKKPVKGSDVRIDWRVQKFLTQYQYAISEERCPLKEKIRIIEDAIRDGKNLEIIYLKAKDVKSKRIISPKEIGDRQYMEKTFLGVDAWCFSRQDMRVFRVDRILEIRAQREKHAGLR